MLERQTLADTVLLTLGPGRDENLDAATLQQTLEVLWSDAQRSWPGVRLDPTTWAAEVANRLSPTRDLIASIRALETDDLYVVLGCIHGDAVAARRVHETIDALEPTLRRAGATSTAASEVLAHLKLRLLSPDRDGQTRLLQYGARAKLGSWLRVAAMRDFNALRKRERVHEDDSALADILISEHDPGLAAFHKRFEAAFKDAFRAAVRGLSAKDRDILRHHLVERLTIDRIGALYDVHRSTAARWLTSIRDQLHTHTRTTLRAQLGLSASEFESVMQSVLSQLSYSIGSELEP